MTALEYLRGIRRRWLLILACVIVAMAAGWLTTDIRPPTPKVEQQSLYSATVIILGPPGPTTGIGSLTTLAALTKIGEVPARVAETLDRDDPVSLASAISTIADPETGLLTISGRASSPTEAQVLANEFANELVRYQADQFDESGLSVGSSSTIKVIQRGKPHPGLPVPVISLDTGQADDPRASAYIAPGGLEEAELEEIAGRPVLETGWRVPPGHPVRLLISAGLGLLFGALLALILERYDTTLSTRRAAEEHFSFPVLSVIPAVSRRARRSLGTVLTSSPHSASADAFRLLSAALRFGTRAEGIASRAAEPEKPPQVILVTSPSPGEGKSTVAANLAASFTEIGQRVLVMSCDFRNPTIHDLLGVSNAQGLVDAIGSSNGAPVLGNGVVLTPSGNPSMQVVPTGTIPNRPAHALNSHAMQKALSEARMRADVVVIDTTSLTTASDAALLFPQVDAVLVVAHARKTTADRADVADEILQRFEAPVVGVVLNAVRSTESGRRYKPYRSNNHADQTLNGSGRGRGFPRLSRHRKKSQTV